MKFIFAILVGALALDSGTAARAQAVDYLKALVGDSVITFWQVHQYAQQQLEDERDPARRTKIEDEALTVQVNQQLALQGFKELEKKGVKIPDSIIDRLIAEDIKKRFGSDIEFNRVLELQGMTREDYRKDFKDKFIANEMARANVPDPIISPHKVELYYQAHSDIPPTRGGFKLEERVKYRFIALKKDGAGGADGARKRAGDILKLLQGGAAFTEVALTYNEVKSSRDSAPPEWFEISELDKDLIAGIKKLKPGELPGEFGLAETESTCFVLSLEAHEDAHVRPLNEVRDQIEGILKSQERNRMQQQWIDRLRTKTFVQMY